MKKNISIGVDGEKISALEMYLKQKNIILKEELEKCIDGLYQKYVPNNVREYIEMAAVRKPSKKDKKVIQRNDETVSEP